MDNGNGSSLAVCAHADLPLVFSGKAGVSYKHSKSKVPRLPLDEEEREDVHKKQTSIVWSMSSCEARFNYATIWAIINKEKGHLQVQWHNNAKTGWLVLHCFRCNKKTEQLYFKGSYAEENEKDIRRISVDRII